MRDSQKQKVYDWEDSQSWMIKRSYLSQEQCHQVIKRLNKIFRRKVKLRFRNGHGSCYAFNRNEIMIRNQWGRSYSVLLHEYAHCLTNDYHGGWFVSEFCMLLHHLHPDEPAIKDLVKSLNDANVQFNDFEKTKCRKRLSKRHKPFEDVSTEPIKVPVKKKRVSAKQRVENLMTQHESLCVSYWYGDMYIEYEGEEEVIFNARWKQAEEYINDLLSQ